MPQSDSVAIQLTAEPASLDPALAEDGLSLRVLSALMTGLLRYDGDGALVPGLAETVVLDSKDKLIYRVHLRQGITWSDGKPVLAEHFIYGMKRTLDPGTPAKLADLLYCIKGAKDYKRGRLKSFDDVGVRAVSSSDLYFTLEKPCNYFPHILALAIALPARQDMVSSFGSRWVAQGPTTGPYVMRSLKDGVSYELSRHPGTNIFSKTAPENIVFRVVTEEITAMGLFDTGKLDVVTRFPILETDRLRARGLLRTFPFAATYYVGFNHRLSPWHSQKARASASAAIDREGVVELLKGDADVAFSWMKNSLAVSKAQEPAKIIQGNGDSFVIGYDSGHRNQLILEKVQEDFRKKLAIRVTLRARDWKTYLRELSVGPSGMFRFGWLSPFLHPYAHLMVFRSDSLNNYTGWKSSKFDALTDAVAATSDPEKLKYYVIQADHLLVEEEAVIAPVYHYRQSVVVSQRLKNLKINALGFVDFAQLQKIK